MRPETSKAVVTVAPNLTPQEFAQYGDGSLAYVKTIASEDVARLFPQAPEMRPGLTLFALLGADGSHDQHALPKDRAPAFALTSLRVGAPAPTDNLESLGAEGAERGETRIGIEVAVG
jgi:hypothetical protein